MREMYVGSAYWILPSNTPPHQGVHTNLNIHWLP